jgi:hypothetical protein
MIPVRVLIIVVVKHQNLEEGLRVHLRFVFFYPNFTTSKFVAISIFVEEKKRYALSLEFVSLRKKVILPLLLLRNTCKLSCFVGYRCLEPYATSKCGGVVACT